MDLPALLKSRRPGRNRRLINSENTGRLCSVTWRSMIRAFIALSAVHKGTPHPGEAHRQVSALARHVSGIIPSQRNRCGMMPAFLFHRVMSLHIILKPCYDSCELTSQLNLSANLRFPAGALPFLCSPSHCLRLSYCVRKSRSLQMSSPAPPYPHCRHALNDAIQKTGCNCERRPVVVCECGVP